MAYLEKISALIKLLKQNPDIIVEKDIIVITKSNAKKEEKEILKINKDFEVDFTNVLKETYNVFGNVHIRWSYKKNEEDIPGGEFKIKTLQDCFYGDYKLSYNAMDKKQKELLSNFRVFEEHPIAGDGILSCLIVEPRTTSPQVWLYDNGEAYKLTIELQEYFDYLILSKGFFYWPYLFVEDIKKVKSNDIIVEQLDLLMKVLPEYFPSDYSDFDERWKKIK